MNGMVLAVSVPFEPGEKPRTTDSARAVELRARPPAA